MIRPYYEDQSHGITLYCGKREDVLPQLDAYSISAIVTDPPYGIQFVKGRANCAGGFGRLYKTIRRTETRPIFGDDSTINIRDLLGFQNVWIWGADHLRDQLPSGGTFVAWDKHLGRGPNDDFIDCEFAWTNATKVKRNVIRFLWKGAACQKAGEHDGRGQVKRWHPSQKPIGVMVQAMELAKVEDGALVCDPYAGACSTGIACIRTGRPFVGIEIEEYYCEIGARRLRKEAEERAHAQATT